MFSAQTKEAANATLSDAKSTAYNVKRDFSNTADEATSEFERAANRVGKQVRGFVDTASDQITDASEKVTSEIRSNPIRSSAVALGIGFILGSLLRR